VVHPQPFGALPEQRQQLGRDVTAGKERERPALEDGRASGSTLPGPSATSIVAISGSRPIAAARTTSTSTGLCSKMSAS
jgi:hypothetical protein